MSRLTARTLSPEIMGIMLPMRLLIKNEFGQTLSLYDEAAVHKFCEYGFRSQHPKLAALTQQLASLTGTTAPTPLAHMAGTIVDWFDSTDFVLPVRITYHKVPHFVIDKPKRRCLLSSDLEALLPLGRAEASMLRLEALSPLQLITMEKHSHSIPLEALWWFCGIRLSHGRLLHRLTTYHAFRLKRWPDFGVLPHHRPHTRMAAFLTKRASSLETFTEAMGVQQDEVVGFLNASSLCGWLQDEPQSSPAPAASAPSRPGLQGMIGRIRMRLGLGR